MEFIHLNVQTSKGSFLDSSIKIKELIKYAKENNITTIGIRDISFFGVIDFFDECNKEGIKPIFGKIVSDDFDLVYYPKSIKGYHSLLHHSNELNSGLHAENRIDDNICVIPRHNGRLHDMLFHTNCDENTVDDYLQHYKDLYGEDLYLEISDNELVYEKDINELIIQAANRNEIKVILANPVKYLNKEDQPVHNLLSRIRYNAKNDNKKLKGSNYFFRTKSSQFNTEYTQQLVNTIDIGSKISHYDIHENDGKYFMHKFPNDDAELKKICEDSLQRYGLSENTEYIDRLSYELSVISKEGFCSYFILVAKMVQWCNEQGILVGVGRGSAGGSLVSYLTGITGFDPMNKNCPLYFERFLNPARVSPPDIDVDITDRNRVIEYAKQEYGKDRVVNIGTVHTFGTRDSLGQVARMYNINDKDLKPLYNCLPVDMKEITNELLYETSKDFKEIIDNNALLKNIWQYAVKIEGLCKNAGIHASGVVISPIKMNIPTNMSKGVKYSEYDMHNVEDIGYIKFDFLGLNTLNIVEKTVEKIRKNKDPEFDIKNVDYWQYDKATYDLINQGKTTCVFQWESDGYKNLIRRLKPDEFNELIDLNTLYRPGPMESGMTDLYIKRKFGLEKVEYTIPELKPYLKRKGLPLFQEEIMKMCEIMAGFTLAEADMIRKAIGKKIPKEMTKMKTKFIDGCMQTSKLSKERAIEEWEKLEKFQRYSWNLSHGLAYTIISYWTAYLSANYPAEFFAANMDTKINDHDRLVVIINELKSRGINILPPDINNLEFDHTVKDGSVYMTLDSIKGIGEKAKETILSDRKTNGEFKNFEDFNNRIDKRLCNAAAKEALIYAGVFDSFYDDGYFITRYKLLDKVINKKNEKKMEEYKKLNSLQMIRNEAVYLGFYLTATPTDILKLKIYSANTGTFEIISMHNHIDKKGNKMCFLSATDYLHMYEFVVFSKAYEEYGNLLSVGNIVIINFTTQKSNYSCVLKMVLPVYVDGKLILSYRDKLLPVVDIKTEMSNNLDFSRYVIKEIDSGKVLVYKKDGPSKFYSITKIIGYR
jgi:DNA polymerase-3 subunit alpha